MTTATADGASSQGERKKSAGRPRGYITDYKPQQSTVKLLDDAKAVLEEYRAYWPLTVRQVFYRLIGAHGYEKSEAFYKKLCHHLANARRGRAIPFEAIRDDGVSLMPVYHFEDADHFFQHVRRLGTTYTRDRQAHQKRYIEVWCEAAGMVPQLAEVARDYSVVVYSSSGFDSVTAKHDLAVRICEQWKPATILHLGDFDPSGQSIFDVIGEDVAAFVREDRPNALVSADFRRVALTADQVRRYDLPTAPPKATDSRAKGWTETCQLEALPPDVITRMLRQTIESLIDKEQLEHDRVMEVQERQQIAYLLPPGRQN